jgi:AraC family transcriptional regulator of adaptative response/methylated-DNA-[protein]-cysteine methyltransferase
MKSNQHYQLITQSLFWLCENQDQQPSLDELAKQVGLSPQYLQRVFQDWAGVTPKQFLKYLTKKDALKRLAQGQTVLDAALESGLSGPGRLHDLLITTEAMTPGEARRKGQGVDVAFGYGETPFGEALLAWTDKGICFLGFSHEIGKEHVWSHFQQQWPDANLLPEPDNAQLNLASIFSGAKESPLKLWLRGSPFQLRIWEALLKLPGGIHCTYGQLASHIGKSGASQATGSAIGRNPVSWLIPCHRVINSLGTLGGYRWGLNTKQAMIAYEAAIAHNPVDSEAL